MKLRIALATASLGALTLLAGVACGTGDSDALLSPEASALSSLGFATGDLTLASGEDGSTAQAGDGRTAQAGDGGIAPAGDPAPAASASAGGKGGAHQRRWARLTIRRALARNVEHGEVVVDTKQGAKTIDVQRGTVTAITATTITVKSTDGFTLTWTFGSPIHVVEHRTSVQPGEVKTGATVGVAGLRSGDVVTAKLIVIPNPTS